jgi:chromosome segregation ATPase
VTLAERLADAHQRSVALYLRRQQIEAQRQQIQQQAQACDLELVKLDGEIEVLKALITEVSPG